MWDKLFIRRCIGVVLCRERELHWNNVAPMVTGVVDAFHEVGAEKN